MVDVGRCHRASCVAGYDVTVVTMVEEAWHGSDGGQPMVWQGVAMADYCG